MQFCGGGIFAYPYHKDVAGVLWGVASVLPVILSTHTHTHTSAEICHCFPQILQGVLLKHVATHIELEHLQVQLFRNFAYLFVQHLGVYTPLHCSDALFIICVPVLFL